MMAKLPLLLVGAIMAFEAYLVAVDPATLQTYSLSMNHSINLIIQFKQS